MVENIKLQKITITKHINSEKNYFSSKPYYWAVYTFLFRMGVGWRV